MPPCTWGEWGVLSTACLHVNGAGKIQWHGAELFALMGHDQCLAAVDKLFYEKKGVPECEMLKKGSKYDTLLGASAKAIEGLARCCLDAEFVWVADPKKARTTMWATSLPW